MLKFVIVFQGDIQQPSFENAYNDFLALAERMPGIRRRQVVHALGSPQGVPPLSRQLELYFDSQAAMQAALMSPQGQEAGAELNRFPAGSVATWYGEVYEDGGTS